MNKFLFFILIISVNDLYSQNEKITIFIKKLKQFDKSIVKNNIITYTDLVKSESETTRAEFHIVSGNF